MLPTTSAPADDYRLDGFPDRRKMFWRHTSLVEKFNDKHESHGFWVAHIHKDAKWHLINNRAPNPAPERVSLLRIVRGLG